MCNSHASRSFSRRFKKNFIIMVQFHRHLCAEVFPKLESMRPTSWAVMLLVYVVRQQDLHEFLLGNRFGIGQLHNISPGIFLVQVLREAPEAYVGLTHSVKGWQDWLQPCL